MRNILFLLAIFSGSALGDYLIVRVDGDTVIPVDPVDSNVNLLYDILLKNSWPTSLAYEPQKDTGVHEEDQLKLALKKHNLADQYAFIWFPNILHEVFISYYLLDNNEEFLRKTFRQKNIISDGVKPYHLKAYSDQAPLTEEDTEGGFTGQKFISIVNSNEKAERTAELVKNDRSLDPTVLLHQYFMTLNEKAREVFFRANHGFGVFLKNHDPSCLNVSSLQLLGKNGEKLRGLMAKLTPRFNEVYNRSLLPKFKQSCGSGDGAPGFLFPDPQVDPKKMEILFNTIDLEIKAHLENKALIYRGSSGYEGMLDNALLKADFIYSSQSPCASISFGASSMGGYFHDSMTSGRGSVKGTSACALHYMLSDEIKFSYVVRIDKDTAAHPGSDIQQLFTLPPLGIIGRVFGRGEYFHPRTKVGIKGSAASIFKGLNSGRAEMHTVLGFVVAKNFPPEEMALLVNDFIAKNSVVIHAKQ